MSKETNSPSNDRAIIEMFKTVKELNHSPNTTDEQRGQMMAILGQAVEQYTSNTTEDQS